jgi:hypothetical protein
MVPRRELALELSRKLLHDEIAVRSCRNVVLARG